MSLSARPAYTNRVVIRVVVQPVLQGRAKAQAIPVAVLDIEIAAAVVLVAQVAGDLHAFRLEFRIQSIRVVNPDVGVPGAFLWIRQTVRIHASLLLKLAQ